MMKHPQQTKTKANKIFVFDVMLNGRFVCTLKYEY